MTQLTFDRPGQHLFIRAVDAAGIHVGEQRFTRSLIITGQDVDADWPPQSVEDIESSHLEVLLTFDPELAIIGTGARQVFLHPERLAPFYRRQVGIEVMHTAAACKTFNVLVSEGRKVVAALLPPTA